MTAARPGCCARFASTMTSTPQLVTAETVDSRPAERNVMHA
jgi:hypothetical protein